MNWRLGQLAIGLELDWMESQVEERERNTGESPPAKLGGRERDFCGEIDDKITYKYIIYRLQILTRSSMTVSSSLKSVEPSSLGRFQSVLM